MMTLHICLETLVWLDWPTFIRVRCDYRGQCSQDSPEALFWTLEMPATPVGKVAHTVAEFTGLSLINVLLS